MKILVVADVESKYIWDFFDKEKFSDIELIISCGDLNHSYLSFLVTMISAPLLYIHGNHDYRYIQNPPLGCDSIEDTIVVHNGLRILGLGGSMKYNDKSFQYTEKEMSKRIKKLRKQLKKNMGFDILVTHAPPYGLGDGEDLCHRGFESFNKLIDDYTPACMFHGHQHLNYGRNDRIIQYKNTILINAYGYHIFDTNTIFQLGN